MGTIVEGAKSLALGCTWWLCATCIGALLFAGSATVAAAQSAPAALPSAQMSAKTKDAPTRKHSAKHTRKKHAARKQKRPVPIVASVPQPPPPPPPPDWPALSAPAPAIVHWDGKQLSVAARNSSLMQTLQAVSAATHIPVTGLKSDQRLFGDYGPGTPRQVLSDLLEGSGYDLLMVGGSDPGVPKSVELSRRSGASEPPERAAYTPPENSSYVNPALAQQQLAPAPQTPPQPFNRPPGMTPQDFNQQRMQMMQQQNAQQQRPQ